MYKAPDSRGGRSRGAEGGKEGGGGDGVEEKGGGDSVEVRGGKIVGMEDGGGPDISKERVVSKGGREGTMGTVASEVTAIDPSTMSAGAASA